MSNEKLCFTPLDSTYIKNPQYSRKELELEHKKYIEDEGEDISYNEFFDMYCIDIDSDPEYIAVENMESTFKVIQTELSNWRKKRSRTGLRKFLNRISVASIGIYDSDVMAIYTNSVALQKELLNIISKYQ